MTQTKALNPALKVVIIVAVLLILLLGVYLAGNIILPGSIKSSYQSKNCEQVLSLDGIYASAYPAFMTDKSVADLTKECALYLVAVENEQNKAWQSAYSAYQTYKQTYSNGLFAIEADEHSAQILIITAKDQLAAKQYADAIGNINLVLKNHGSTSAASEAKSLMSDVYIAWAKDQRASSDFSGAEATLKTFSAWASDIKNTETLKVAQRELAQTYLAWGLALQEQQQFEDARTKLELVISTDPEPLAKTGPAMQAKAAKIALYTGWGDALMAKDDFAGALDRYQTVIALSEEPDKPTAKDHIADVYLKWATKLRSTEDFLGATDKIEDAAKNAGTDAGKKSVESAQTDVYTAFSNSTGKQAVQAMKDAIKDVCNKNKKPTLPIFGLDKEHIQAGIYGVDDKLPANVAATTPGALHYVACIEMNTETVQTKTFFWAKFVAEKYVWNVTLRKVTDPESITTTSIAGGTPPPLPEITRANYMAYLLGSSLYRSRGSNPDPVALANWMLTVMK